MPVQNVHQINLSKATTLSGFTVENLIDPIEVVKILNAEKISFVLVGMYGLGGWIHESRATEDVDVIVAAKHVKKAVKALLKAFPYLEADDKVVVVRLRHRETHDVHIDVMKPNQQLFRKAFKHASTQTSKGQTYKIPTLEMALAMKFAPMVSLHRQDEDKYQDAHDFILMVKSNAEIDLKKLAELGDLVYPEGGKELLEKVRQVQAGEKLQL
jgi:hypothetical protein